MYIVVLRNISQQNGVVFQRSFESQQDFSDWYSGAARMGACYKVIEEGVTVERAAELCSVKTGSPKVEIRLEVLVFSVQ